MQANVDNKESRLKVRQSSAQLPNFRDTLELKEGSKKMLSSRADKRCGCKATVLLVDDCHFNLIPLRAILEEDFDIEVDEAMDGQQALRMYEENMRKTCCDIRYQLILTDIMMPVMDGIEEAKSIFALEKELEKDMPNLPKIQIIAVTAGENS